MIESFLKAIDEAWTPTRAVVPLRVLGCTALIIRHGYTRGTKDSDVLETAEVTPEIKRQLISLAGENTDLHRRHRLYLDIVGNGIPFLPHALRWHTADDLNRSLRHFNIEVLDVVDVTISKLKRFSGNDRADIEAMIDGGFVGHRDFVERFKLAVDSFAYDARAEDLPSVVANFHQIERDVFAEPETDIELPPWI